MAIDRQEIAKEYFIKGFNCAQSVVVAFKDLLNLSEDQLLNLAAPFGAGFARSRNLCGAVSAIGIVLGLLKEGVSKAEDKGAVYEQVGEIAKEFESINGTIICKDLLKNVPNLTAGYKPQDRNAEYYKVRPCLKFVLDAVDLIEKNIK